jgi:uncharacterized Ntn-hydrolase superfamily protein
MRTIILILLFNILIMVSNTFAQSFYSEPFAHTYSIVARDPETGEMGVAVQSHWFSVGSVVAWGEAGVGVVATQSFVNVSFGLRGLELLKSGKTSQEAVDELIAGDEGRDERQLAILDSKGNVASYTGKKCIPEAGNLTGVNYSVQANMMLNNTVWKAMSEAFENSTGPLAERMITSLEAAQNEGGDIRGRQSASILIVRGESTGNKWEDKLIDLRVEDSDEPIKELKRLLKLHRAYEHMNNGDLAIVDGDIELALKEYSTAEEMFPDNLEMKFWHAVTLASVGKIDESLPLFKAVFAGDPNWRELLIRLPKVDLLSVSEEDMERIKGQ